MEESKYYSTTSYLGKILEAGSYTKGQYGMSSCTTFTSQHGFIPKRSCLTNLLEFLSCVSMLMHTGVIVSDTLIPSS